MADMTREQERNELHRAIWAMADELRGSIGGWEFKSYVLGTMFYRYISENLTNYINAGEIEAGRTALTMPNSPMKMQKRRVMVLSRKRASSCCRLSCSAMFAHGPRRTKLE